MAFTGFVNLIIVSSSIRPQGPLLLKLSVDMNLLSRQWPKAVGD